MKKVIFGLALLFSASVFCSCAASASKDQTINENKNTAVNVAADVKENPVVTNETTPVVNKGAADLKEDYNITYRVDGSRPGIASEYIQVILDNKNMVTKMYYWNTSDENKITLKITRQKFTDGEISALDGEVKFPGEDESCKFVMMEQHLNLDCGGMFQEFEMEEN